MLDQGLTTYKVMLGMFITNLFLMPWYLMA